MKKSKSEQWLEALAWDDKTLGVPTIVSQTIAKEAGKVLHKAKAYKPPIRIPKATQRVPLAKLKKELDRVFSIFIRTRDRWHGTAELGQCVTCGLVKPWREMDAGHYVPRQFLVVRWDEKNVHIQCKACNGFRGGEPEKMACYIDGLYGAGTARDLTGKRSIKTKLYRPWLEAKIKEYKKKIGEK